MSPELARLRALAARTALEDHDYVFYGSAVMLPPTDKAGHVLNFTTCPHPDCQLVREPLAASSSPAWEPKLKALIERWRDRAGRIIHVTTHHPDDGARQLLKCADELEALLPPAPKEHP